MGVVVSFTKLTSRLRNYRRNEGRRKRRRFFKLKRRIKKRMVGRVKKKGKEGRTRYKVKVLS